jgi:hypothetical protein
MKRSIVLALVLIVLLVSGCQSIGTPSPTAISETDTPTNTTHPPSTPTATQTPSPTDTPTQTITPTPGPLKITDDFSTKSDIWGSCPGCEWKDGKLYVGPYDYSEDPTDLYRVVCEACGEPIFYRVSATVQFIEGSGLDRGFGLLVHDSNTRLLDLEITTGQFNAFFEFNYSTERWRLMIDPKKVFAKLFPSYEENRLEVVAKPSNTKGMVDYEVNINDSTAYYIWSQNKEPGWVGLVVGWHGIGVAFDDFIFEELYPDQIDGQEGASTATMTPDAPTGASDAPMTEEVFARSLYPDTECYGYPVIDDILNNYYSDIEIKDKIRKGYLSMDKDYSVIGRFQNDQWILIEFPPGTFSVPGSSKPKLQPYQSIYVTPTATPRYMGNNACWVNRDYIEIIGSLDTITTLKCYRHENIRPYFSSYTCDPA